MSEGQNTQLPPDSAWRVPPAVEAIQALGRRIETRWLEQNYAETDFPDLAAASLSDLPKEALKGEEIIEWGLQTLDLPRQSDPDGTFGNPPLTVFNGRDFFIDVLFWVDGTTSVHQHSFSGAFRVASGSSLHGQMRFDPARRLSSRIQTGRLSPVSVERLVTGDTRPIRSGDAFIHSLFHLDRPSTTIVVRTREDRDTLPQYEYHPPGLALDPFYRPQWLTRQVQLAQLLITTEDKTFEALFNERLRHADAFSSYRLLNSIRRRVNQTAFCGFLEVVCSKDAEFGRLLGEVFEADRVREFLADRRHQVWDADQRFFLALLMNLQTRAQLLDMAKAYRPTSSPVESVLSWLEGLAALKSVVQFGGGTWQPNPFGLPEFSEEDRRRVRILLSEGSAPAGLETSAVIQALHRVPAFKVLFSA